MKFIKSLSTVQNNIFISDVKLEEVFHDATITSDNEEKVDIFKYVKMEIGHCLDKHASPSLSPERKVVFHAPPRFKQKLFEVVELSSDGEVSKLEDIPVPEGVHDIEEVGIL